MAFVLIFSHGQCGLNPFDCARIYIGEDNGNIVGDEVKSVAAPATGQIKYGFGFDPAFELAQVTAQQR